MVDYSASIKRPFIDIKNLAIGIALSILPIVRWFAFGYALENSGLTKKKIPINKSLEWADWANLFFRGFLASVISFIYFVPALLVFLVGAFSVLAAIISVIGWSVLLRGDSTLISQALQQNWSVILPMIIMALPFIFVGLILALLALYLIPAALMNFLNYGKFGKSFSLSEVFHTAFNGTYCVASLLVGLIMVIVGLVLSWIPWVGGATAYFITAVIGYTIYGQVYREVNRTHTKK